MVAHYNVYYHGEKILNETIEDLAVQHKDDFSKHIEVYAYSDEATATSLKPKMEEVMKKASIIISKRTRSKWVDDCFLLLGKSHFLLSYRRITRDRCQGGRQFVALDQPFVRPELRGR